MDHRIVDVSKDGVVTAINRQGNAYTVGVVTATHKTRWGSKSYHLIGVYDHDERERQKISYKEKGTYASGIKFKALARVIWAWYHGVAPANMDVDHINNDSLDDRLDNLQLLTRQQNLAKRGGYRNQFESSKVDEYTDETYTQELLKKLGK